MMNSVKKFCGRSADGLASQTEGAESSWPYQRILIFSGWLLGGCACGCMLTATLVCSRSLNPRDRPSLFFIFLFFWKNSYRRRMSTHRPCTPPLPADAANEILRRVYTEFRQLRPPRQKASGLMISVLSANLGLSLDKKKFRYTHHTCVCVVCVCQNRDLAGRTRAWGKCGTVRTSRAPGLAYWKRCCSHFSRLVDKFTNESYIAACTQVTRLDEVRIQRIITE